MSGYIYIYNTYIQHIKNSNFPKKLGNIKYMYFERSNLGPIRNDTYVYMILHHMMCLLLYIC